jgi:hypothetical protein
MSIGVFPLPIDIEKPLLVNKPLARRSGLRVPCDIRFSPCLFIGIE